MDSPEAPSDHLTPPVPVPVPVSVPMAPEPGDPPELRKPHEMIVLMPRSRRVTLTGRRLYNALLQVAQARLAAMSQMPSADYMFEAPLPALLRSSGSSGEDRTAAKRYLREMRGLEVDWESTAPGDGVKWRGFSMLSEVAIELRHGENWVSWSYPPTMMAALKEPTRWARIDLDILARLGTYAAVALYEICARYRDNPSGLTSRKPVQWWADALSPAPAGSERREWRKFKNERIKDAIEDINRETDLDIELIEHKQGRAVVEAQFSVRRKRGTARLRPQQAAPIDAHLVLRAESLGVRESKLEGLLLEFGEEALREALDQLERRSANQHLRGVENGYSYLRALLRHAEPANSAGTARPLPPAGVAEGMLRPVSFAPGTEQLGTPLGVADFDGLPQDRVGTDRPAGPPDQAGLRTRSLAGTGPGGRADSGADQGAGAGAGAGPSASMGASGAAAAVATPPPLRTADDDWLAARIAQVKLELAALDPAQRQPWVDRALAELADKRLLSAVISRRAAQGDVLHGLLGSVIVRLYAQARHGPGWDRPPAAAARPAAG